MKRYALEDLAAWSRKNDQIQAKAGTNLKSKSLNTYRTKFSQRLAARVSPAHFGNTDGLLSIPLYAVGLLAEYLP